MWPPPHPPSYSDTYSGSERRDTRQGASDDQFLYLAGALVEGHHAGVAQQLADRVLVDVAVPPVHLEGVVRRAHGRLGGEELGLGGLGRERQSAVHEVG